MTPLPLDSAGLEGARTALAPPERRRTRVRTVLACAVALAATALALCAVVLQGVGSPPARPEGAGWRGELRR